MVIRHFGSKDRLFAEAMRRPDLLQTRLSPKDREGLGERLVRYALSLDGDSREYHMLVALLRSASHTPAAGALGEMSEDAVKIVEGWLAGSHSETRAALICSQLTGIFILRSVFQIKSLSLSDDEEIVRRISPSIQALIDE